MHTVNATLVWGTQGRRVCFTTGVTLTIGKRKTFLQHQPQLWKDCHVLGCVVPLTAVACITRLSGLLIAQNGTEGLDSTAAVLRTADSAFVMSGDTNGSYVEASNGEFDFVAIKIDDHGTVLWQWQVYVE